MIVADSWFTIGSAHVAEGSPCQDYALAEGAYAVVADGCSSSPMTDVGARILAHTAKAVYAGRYASEEPLSVHRSWTIAADAKFAADCLTLPIEALDASLAVVKCNSSGLLSAVLFGDGVIAYRKNGLLCAVTVDWAGNMPGYLMYDYDGIRRHEFIRQSEQFAAEFRSPCEVKRWDLMPGQRPRRFGVGFYDAACGLRGHSGHQYDQSIDLVAVFTDGVTQISGVPWYEAVATLMDFRGPLVGEFVKRRMRAALKTWAKDGHVPADDIAMAAVYRGSDENLL